jgi:hypothetical protein
MTCVQAVLEQEDAKHPCNTGLNPVLDRISVLSSMLTSIFVLLGLKQKRVPIPGLHSPSVSAGLLLVVNPKIRIGMEGSQRGGYLRSGAPTPPHSSTTLTARCCLETNRNDADRAHFLDRRSLSPFLHDPDRDTSDGRSAALPSNVRLPINIDATAPVDEGLFCVIDERYRYPLP